jgi:hypothetical protein
MSKKRKRPGGGQTAKAQGTDEPNNLPAKAEPRQAEKVQPWDDHARAISAAWQKGLDSILETGRLLLKAKEELDEHGAWLPMIRKHLPFGPNMAQRLMKIARNPILTNTARAPFLPAHSETLYQLTRLDEKLGEGTLLAKIEDGTITPKTKREEVTAWLNPPSDGDPPPTIAKRNGYIDFLKTLKRKERVEELAAFFTAIGALVSLHTEKTEKGMRFEVVDVRESGDNADDPAASAEAMKAQFAERDGDQTKQPPQAEGAAAGDGWIESNTL